MAQIGPGGGGNRGREGIGGRGEVRLIGIIKVVTHDFRGGKKVGGEGS